jgi:beta-N-acetylhexosaminidase
MINLKDKPFYLKDEDIEWVEKTLAEMTEDEKLGQLFCLVASANEPEFLKNLALNYKPGGIMCRPMSAAENIQNVRVLQENSKIPMLIAANLESGGNGIVKEGTKLGSQMQVAATDDDEMAYKLGTVCGREGAAVGANWAFAPIIDIDYNFRNPITNTRTLGSEPDRVRRMGVQYVKAVQQHGVAASIKHFPGDGVDERDQHLVTTINSFSCEEWDKTFGEVYKACIDAGAMTVMIGHIMQPAYTRKFNPEIKDRDILPASLSYEITTKLLKEQLGFNGLVVTDATTMAGMQMLMSRAEAVPLAIAAGCDMFLFTRNLDEDYRYMKKGIEEGIITQERLNEALTKILALKAALKLHKKKVEGTLLPIFDEAMKVLDNEEHKAWAKECADKAITIVKEEKSILPISPDNHKRVLFYGIESGEGYSYGVRAGVIDQFKKLLEKEGFEVEQFDPAKGLEGRMRAFSDVEEKYDLIIYLANLATKSNQTTIRIEWAMPMGANVPVFMSVVPTIFISVENPYHLQDVPRVRTYINAYNSTDIVLEELVDKLMGRSEFKGTSPVDAFCGMWDTRL